jgi:hypothetical protein
VDRQLSPRIAAAEYLVLSPALQVTVALIPVIPFVFFVRRFILHLRNLDELHRRVHFEALAIAFPMAILLLMTLGLLERSHVLSPSSGASPGMVLSPVVLSDRSGNFCVAIDDQPSSGASRGATLVAGGAGGTPRRPSRQTVNAEETERYEPSL